MKKTHAIVVTALITLVVAIPVFAAVDFFTDGSTFAVWYKDSVNQLFSRGIIAGYPDGSFKPGNNVSRAELAVIINRLDNLHKAETATSIMKAFHSYEWTSKLSIDSDYKVAIAMVDAGIAPKLGKLELTKASEFGSNAYKLPFKSDQDQSDDLDEDPLHVIVTPIDKMPTNYEVYLEDVGADTGLNARIFIRHTFQDVFCGIAGCVNKGPSAVDWYGPFEF